MSVKVSGMAAVESALRQKLGKAQVDALSDKALIKASEVFIKELKAQLKTFKDTGATIDEVTTSKPYTLNGVRNITVYWSGPKERYRLIHLNEYGTVKNPNPRGKGAIARALQASESAYRQAVEDELRRSL